MLHLRLHGSRLELAILLICYALTQSSMARSGFSLSVILMGSGVLVALTLCQARQVLLLPKYAVIGIDLTVDGRALLYTGAGLIEGRLSRIVYSNYWLTVLEFRVSMLSPRPGGGQTAVANKCRAHKLRLCIAPDSVGRQSRKELVVFLRYFLSLSG